MPRLAFILLTLALHAAFAQAFPDAARMRADLVYLTSAKLKGRRSMESGSNQAGRFIAAEFEKAGLKPAGGKSYFGEYRLVTYAMPGKARLRIHHQGKAFECGFALDFPANSARVTTVKAPLVFAGYGITEPGYDDYAGLDVRGRIVMVFDPEPGEFSSRIGRGLAAKALNAQKHGAIGLLAVGQPPAPAQNAPSAPGLPAPKPGKVKPEMQTLEAGDLRIPAFRMMTGDAVTMLRATGREADQLRKSIAARRKPDSFPMPGFDVEIRAGGAIRKRGSSFNVMGMIEGSDPSLRNETILLCAHYDHLGTNWGTIFRGANDNASGTAALLELARAWKHGGARPRRTLMFVAFGSEEQGLLGSRYYTINPLRPLPGTVTLNLDMIGSPERPNQIQLVGGKLNPELRQVVLRQNETVGLQITEELESDLLFRSDHYPFLLAGAPAIQFFAGSGPDYHQPTDTVERLDFEKLAKVTRLAHLVATELANRGALPRFAQQDGIPMVRPE